MSTPFAFVPRSVSKHAKEWQGISRRSPTPSPDPDPIADADADTDTESDSYSEPKSNPKQSTVPQDIAALVALALSDYNIWLDHDLRSKLDATLSDDANDAGFVPINYLLRRAPFRGSLLPAETQPSEMEVVKALRTHASCTLEVRMRLPAASSVWYGAGKTSRKKDVGGYEVRRRDWTSLHERPSRGWTRARWDDLTVYMECIPPTYRSIGAIARFVTLLLSETRAESGSDGRVEYVSLPPHYLDKPGDAPQCKGYALVALSSKPHLEAFLRAWPWKRHPVPTTDTPPIIKDAYKYGLRAISKARWDALNEEYLVYKRSLVDKVARAEIGMRHGASDDVLSNVDADMDTGMVAETLHAQTTSSSPYPLDCLVFARNVHPDTNKTTLRTLFTQAFREQSGTATTTASLDYVDFNKGTDTCHVRLASSAHATRLLAYFDARLTVQAHGLDATGRAPCADHKPIAVERVQGKKEALYWDKIPEKVRRQAVDRVVQAQTWDRLARANESGESRVASDTDVRNHESKKRTRTY